MTDLHERSAPVSTLPVILVLTSVPSIGVAPSSTKANPALLPRAIHVLGGILGEWAHADPKKVDKAMTHLWQVLKDSYDFLPAGRDANTVLVVGEGSVRRVLERYGIVVPAGWQKLSVQISADQNTIQAYLGDQAISYPPEWAERPPYQPVPSSEISMVMQ